MMWALISRMRDDFDGFFNHDANRPYVGRTYETKTASSKSTTIGRRATLLTSHSINGGANNIASRETQTTSTHLALATSARRHTAERAIPATLRTIRPRL